MLNRLVIYKRKWANRNVEELLLKRDNIHEFVFRSNVLRNSGKIFILAWFHISLKTPFDPNEFGGEISLLAFEYFQLLEIAKHCPKVKGSYFASHGLRRLFSSILNECHENFLSWVIVDGIEDILNWHQLCRNKCQRSFQFVDSVSIFSFIGSLIIQPGNFKLLFQWSFFSRSNTL